jgi:elongator complex protein 2
LASGSQDNTIRLWTIEPLHVRTRDITDDDLNDPLLDALETLPEDLIDGEEGGHQISMKRHVVAIKSDSGR